MDNKEHRIDYPFHKPDDEAGWRVGCRRFEFPADDGWHTDYDFVCDGIGIRILTDVETVKMPGKFQNRIVFIKQYIDPDGKKSGKSVHVVTINRFNQMKEGFVSKYDKTLCLGDTEICYNEEGKLL